MSQRSSRAVSGYQTPAEEREMREIKSVALAQPHRRGNEDVKAGSPLWEACCRLKLNDGLYEAGEKYGDISRAYKASLGIGVGNVGNGLGVLDEEAEEARMKLAKDRYWKAINVLRRAHSMSQGVVERVCYNERPLSFHEDKPFIKGLEALADHLRTLDRGINEGKPY